MDPKPASAENPVNLCELQILVYETTEPGPGEAVVDVERVGVCGTDVEFFTGELPPLLR